MSYSCSPHGWHHALSPCPVCTQMRTTTLTSNGAVIGHSPPFRVHEACESRIAELQAKLDAMSLVADDHAMGRIHLGSKVAELEAACAGYRASLEVAADWVCPHAEAPDEFNRHPKMDRYWCGDCHNHVDRGDIGLAERLRETLASPHGARLQDELAALRQETALLREIREEADSACGTDHSVGHHVLLESLLKAYDERFGGVG